MENALSGVAWEACLVQPRKDAALEADARRHMGVPNPHLRYFVDVPWLARALFDMHPEYGLLLKVDTHLADLVGLVVNQENSCRFCYAATRAMLWLQGMSRSRIERLEQDLVSAETDPRLKAAVAFGRAQSRTGPPAAHAARSALLAAGFDADELREIAYAVAVHDFMNRAMTIPAIPARPFEELPDQFFMRLVRPLLQRVVDKRRVRGRPDGSRSEAEPPYRRLVDAYAGSPIAATLSRTLNGMWTSDVLTRRCKLLMLAVIARGLSCEGCGYELRAALQEEGVSDELLDRVLTHLDAPELDAKERLLVPFARETIWYEPAMIQRRARTLTGTLSQPELLEAIGVAALGNGLCRMGPIVLHCE